MDDQEDLPEFARRYGRWEAQTAADRGPTIAEIMRRHEVAHGRRCPVCGRPLWLSMFHLRHPETGQRRHGWC